jgi:alkanesulfonate monooxygenase SsuD/methylene tetrahydromethanopterin reductase-like flavin-dependent oxidoreductase (luciferase family)
VTRTRFGIQFSFVMIPGFSPAAQQQAYAEMTELLPLAEELGFDAFHTTEHHFQHNGWCPSPLIVLAAAAGLTRRMRLVSNVLLVPLYDPIRLAEDIATLDNISGGRITVGVSPGYASEEFEAYRIPREERFRRFEEAIDILGLAWTGEPFGFDGEFFRLPEMTLVPRPVQQPIPVWYGVSGPKLLRRAAARGFPVTASQRHTVSELKDHFARFDAAAAERGAEIKERPIIREAFVAPTLAEAERIAGPALTHIFELYERKSAAGERELRDDDGNLVGAGSKLDFRAYRSRYILGDPAMVAEQVRALEGELRPTELILRMQLPGIPTPDLRRSMELFAHEVRPVLRAD